MSSIIKITLFSLIIFLVIIFNPNPENHVVSEKRNFNLSEMWDTALDNQKNSKSTQTVIPMSNPRLKLDQIWANEINYLQKKHKLSASQIQMAHEVKKHFFNSPVMVHVAFCESSLVHERNGELLKRVGGSDRGLFQINGVHDPDIKRMGLDLNKKNDYIVYTRHLLEKEGVKPWYMSKPTCWGQHHDRIDRLTRNLTRA